MKSFLKISGLGKEQITALCIRASQIKNGAKPFSKKIYVANLFFENSTRTKSSFLMAELKCGLKVLDFDAQHSSATKGESLYDTCKTLQMIGVELFVIRHSQNAYYEELKPLGAAVINAGDGCGEHPSQSLLDLLTIYNEFGHFEGLNVLIVGDVKSSRVAKSNKIALEMLGANVKFASPECYQEQGFSYSDFDQELERSDVCMMLRVQHERHGGDGFLLDEYKRDFCLNKARYERLPAGAIIMHPAPVNRGVEIDSELVEAPKSRIFEQMKNGVFARMAIIEEVLKDIDARHFSAV